MTSHRGWSAVTLAAVQVMGLGVLYAWSVLIEPIQVYFGIGRTSIGMIFSISIAVFTLAVTTAPRLCAGWRLSAVGAVACFMGAAGLAGAALAPSFPIFVVAYGGLFAAASGLGYSAGLKMAVMSGVARSGLATGVIVAAFALGAVILGPVMGKIGSSNTLAAALLLPAAMLAGVGILSLAVQRGCPGLDASFPPHSAAPAAYQHPANNSGYWLTGLLWCGFATGSAGGLMVLGHATGIVAEHGGSVALAGIAVSIIATGNAIGRLTSGAIADRLGPRNVLLFAALMLGLATGLMSLEISTSISVLGLAIAGLAYGVMATGYPVAVHHFFGAGKFALIYGRVFTAWGVAGLIAPFVAGWMFDRTGSYQLALQLATLSAVISFLIAFRFPRASRESEHANKI